MCEQMDTLKTVQRINAMNSHYIFPESRYILAELNKKIVANRNYFSQDNFETQDASSTVSKILPLPANKH